MISLVKIALSPSNDDRVKGGGGLVLIRLCFD